MQISKIILQMGTENIILKISSPSLDVSGAHFLQNSSKLQKLLSDLNVSEIISTAFVIPR